MLSDPAALPLLICLMAMLISSIVGGPTLIGWSVGAASMLGGFSGASSIEVIKRAKMLSSFESFDEQKLPKYSQ
ncbi:unnamed protein product [Schistosoma mattheei]|uniref:Uncharacterized protein n=1 Tax=Schistosoma mattheei TaxID=31246 RepID=A0A183PL11_9TREM|nr:unnamed protein product [Schistosoma mattheei]